MRVASLPRVLFIRGQTVLISQKKFQSSFFFFFFLFLLFQEAPQVCASAWMGDLYLSYNLKVEDEDSKGTIVP